MNNLRKLKTLSGWEQSALLSALLALPVTAAGVQLLGLKKWQRLLAKASRANPTETSSGMTQQIDDARRVARIVGIASRHGVYHANCLQQSLILCWLLKRRNIPSELRLGARKENEKLHAHAWVECGDVVLLDAEDVGHRFEPFTTPVINSG